MNVTTDTYGEHAAQVASPWGGSDNRMCGILPDVTGSSAPVGQKGGGSLVAAVLAILGDDERSGRE